MDAITIVTRRAAGCHRVGRNRNRDLVREYGKRFCAVARRHAFVRQSHGQRLDLGLFDCAGNRHHVYIAWSSSNTRPSGVACPR